MKKMKKIMFNEDKRCNHCSGFLMSTTGFPPAIVLPIKDDVIKVRLHEYDEDNNDIWSDIKDIRINFCPYCGCQLRETVDWSLCD